MPAARHGRSRITRCDPSAPSLVAAAVEVAPELLELEDLRFDPSVNDRHLAFLSTT